MTQIRQALLHDAPPLLIRLALLMLPRDHRKQGGLLTELQ